MFVYRTKDVCAREIAVELEGDIVKAVRFNGGCDGNHKGIASLVEGMTVDEVEKRLAGIRCGFRSTSCPDQLSKAVRAAYEASRG